MWSLFRASALAATCFVAACTTTQLNRNTLDLTASLDSLTTKQILYNLARTIADPYSVPSQATIAAGSVTTTTGFNPQLALPIGATKLVTDAIPNADGKNAVANTYANSALTLGFSDSWEQGWTLDPATDSDQLRRLRALYRYATGQIAEPNHEAEFKCEYPIQAAVRSVLDEVLPPVYVLSCPADEGRTDAVEVHPDPNFVRWPSCVICRNAAEPPFINHLLTYDFIRAAPFPGSRSLGKFGRTELYVCGDKALCGVNGMRAFHELRLFVFEASGQTNRDTGSSKAPSVRELGAPILGGSRH